MSDDMTRLVDITIVGRTLSIHCPASEQAALQQAAEVVDQSIAATLANITSASVEQAALLAALNFCHRWTLSQQHVQPVDQALTQAVDRLLQLVATDRKSPA